MKVVELEDSTRKTYEGYIARTIKPALGNVQAKKLDVRMLESLYTELRRCRVRCDQTPFIEKHKVEEPHDCVNEGCEVHKCRPMAASTVRQVHGIISGALEAAVRWEWIPNNVARVAY